jgi:hypothetical protein
MGKISALGAAVQNSLSGVFVALQYGDWVVVYFCQTPDMR